MLPAGLPDDLSRSSESILDATDRDSNISNFDDAGTRSSDGQQGLNCASSQPSSSHVAAPDDLLEEDEYERFIYDCNSPHTTPLLPAPSMPPLGPIVQQEASLPSYLPASEEVTPTEQTGLESGKAFLVPSDFDKGRYCFTNNDRAMMRLYSLCDQAGSPRYLMDQVLAQLKVEISRNQFDPSHVSITKREAFMARMHRKFPSPPPEPVQVQLESFSEPVTVYRFNAIQQLQQHLLRRDLYGDVNKLNVHPEHRWDQSFLPPSSHMREVTDGSWYKQVISRYIQGDTAHPPSDLDLGASATAKEDQHDPFLISLTVTDNKESFSLESVVLATGLLKSEFNSSNHRLRFIIG